MTTTIIFLGEIRNIFEKIYFIFSVVKKLTTTIENIKNNCGILRTNQ